MDQVTLIRGILRDFCDASGQKVNLAKSKVYFSPNTNDGLATSLSQELGVNITKDLGMYLGAPLLHQRLSKDQFTFLRINLLSEDLFLLQVGLLLPNHLWPAFLDMCFKLLRCRLRCVRKQRRFVGISFGVPQRIRGNATWCPRRKFVVRSLKVVLVSTT